MMMIVSSGSLDLILEKKQNEKANDHMMSIAAGRRARAATPA
jgi:hypothetical protein